MTDQGLTLLSGPPRILFIGQPATGRAWALKRLMPVRWRFEWPLDVEPDVDVWPWPTWRRKATVGVAECGMDALAVRITQTFHDSPAPTALSQQSRIGQTRPHRNSKGRAPINCPSGSPIASLRQIVAEGRGLGIQLAPPRTGQIAREKHRARPSEAAKS